MPTNGCPNTCTWPALGSSSPAATFNSVLLPQPVGPTTLTNSPGATVNVTSSTAVYRCERLSRLTNVHVTPRSSSAAADVLPSGRVARAPRDGSRGAWGGPALIARSPSTLRILQVRLAREIVGEH